MSEEKLVEEIRGYWCEDCQCRDPDTDECFEMAEDHCRGVVTKTITRIGKAVVDGMPLPGEAIPRFQVSALSDKVDTMEGVTRHIKWLADAMAEGADKFIALRPEGHRSRSLRKEEEG